VSAAHPPSSLVLSRENVFLPENTGRNASRILSGAGFLLIGVTAAAMFTGDRERCEAALHGFHIGFLIVLGFSLASMGIVMMLHQVNAGWATTVRRQFENIMGLLWVGGLLFVVDVVLQVVAQSSKEVYLFDWMDHHHVAGDTLYEHKQGYLNVPFFYIRAALYFLVWLGLAGALWSYSTRQDSEGDKWLTARARKVSAPGLLLFAFSTAFAAFDWIMSLDYHWYSTMFGVYFFAGNMVAALSLGTLVLLLIRGVGRLHGAFTSEHLHDLGKLLFGFTCFWAYISFSQYFLIWYANIPEETGWMDMRKQGPWEALSYAVPIGHFIVPFIVLIVRSVRRSRALMSLACLWMIGMHIVDMYWAIRPDARGVAPQWIDAVAIAGPVLLFAGALVRKVASGPLVPLKDPRLPEALAHKNYV